MNYLIEKALILQQGTLSNGAIETFNTLKTMPLETLERKIEEALASKNTAFIATISNILDFGTINSDLGNREKTSLQQKISDKDELEKIKLLLELFEQLRIKIEPAIASHPLTREHDYFKKMRLLANEQDQKLIEMAISYPKSILWLPLDDEKSRLEHLYCKIKSFKATDHMLFNETVLPDIIAAINCNKTAISLDCLRSYVLGKNITSSNLDEEIQAMHIEAKTSMLRAPESQKQAYIETSAKLENVQEEYLTLKRNIEKYRTSKNN